VIRNAEVEAERPSIDGVVALDGPGLPLPAGPLDALGPTSWVRQSGRTWWAPHPGGGGPRSLKVKGVLSRGTRLRYEREAPPVYDPHPGFPPAEHLGVTADGEFTMVPRSIAPLDGLVEAAARRELRNAARLRDAGGAGPAPVGAWRYPDIAFRGERLGIVALELPVAHPHRADVLTRLPDPDLPPPARRHADGLVDLLGGRGPVELRRQRAISHVWTRFGTALSAFHGAGLYRYSGDPENVVYDEGSDTCVLVDLDSSLDLARLEPQARGVQMARDVMSAILNLAFSMLRIPVVAQFASSRQSADPFAAMLGAYYADTAVDARVLDPFLDYLGDVARRVTRWVDERGAHASPDHDIHRCIRGDLDLLYLGLARITVDLHRSSAAARAIAPVPSEQAIDRSIVETMGRRYLDRCRTFTSWDSLDHRGQGS